MPSIVGIKGSPYASIMSITTDPAREFTDFCQQLRVSSEKSGADTLANAFNVSPWGTDFMLILATVHQRITNLHAMLAETELDEDIKQVAFNCLEETRQAFAYSGLANLWSHSISHYLNDTNLMPIRMASAYVRPRHGYTVPDQEGLTQLIGLIEELLTWLRDAELVERDFIRTAIIDGLSGFLFRLQRVGWFGWPDTLESLKAVIAAYLALERGAPELNVSPPYEAMVKKVGGLLKTVFDQVKFAKDVQEAGDWLLRGYGAIQAVGHTYPTIAGLLTHG